jgi:hypothetical protein
LEAIKEIIKEFIVRYPAIVVIPSFIIGIFLVIRLADEITESEIRNRNPQ